MNEFCVYTMNKKGIRQNVLLLINYYLRFLLEEKSIIFLHSEDLIKCSHVFVSYWLQIIVVCLADIF